jgi:hypothetical protein
MHRAHIDISRGLDGETVVFACFDLRADEVAAAKRAVAAVAAERYRTPRISADEVVGLRELTALADELDHGMPPPARDESVPAPESPPDGGGAIAGIDPGDAMRTMVFRPARLSVLRDALAAFVESRDAAEWISAEDREPLALLRAMLGPLEQLCTDAMRAAISPESHAH